MPLEATLLPSATHSEPRPPAAGRASTGSWQSWLFSPVDISFLVVFRVAFGAIMLWHVERYFSPAEQAAFAALPEHLREAAFFRGWVCKEALLKALGRTIAVLDCCDVALHPREAPQLLSLDNDVEAAKCWSLTLWEPAPRYLGAIAVEQNR